MLGHIADGYLRGNTFPESNNMLYSIYNIIYSFHMPLFMMVSGFVYYNAYFDGNGIPNRRRIYRQILNLLIMYVVFSEVFGLFKIVCSNFVNSEVVPTDLLMIWSRPIYPYWYLYVLIFFYILFLCKPIYSINRFVGLAIFLLLSLSSFFINIEWFELSHVMYLSLFFYIGTRHAKKSFNRKWEIATLFILSIILVCAFWNKAYEEKTFINDIPFVNVFVAAGIVLVIWYAFEHIRFLSNNSLLMYCGKYSLEIYVIHCVFTAGLRTVFPRIGITNIYLSMASNFVISIGVPNLFSIISKRFSLILSKLNCFC